MVHYENNYLKEEDPMLWYLHEIRHKIAKQNQSPEQINTSAKAIIRQYKLDHLKFISKIKKYSDSQ